MEPAGRRAPAAGRPALNDGAVAGAGGIGRDWWWLPLRTGEETPPSTPLSHGVKVTAQVLALAFTLWRGQPTASSGCWPRGGPSGKCSPAPWTTPTPRSALATAGRNSVPRASSPDCPSPLPEWTHQEREKPGSGLPAGPGPQAICSLNSASASRPASCWASSRSSSSSTRARHCWIAGITFSSRIVISSSP